MTPEPGAWVARRYAHDDGTTYRLDVRDPAGVVCTLHAAGNPNFEAHAALLLSAPKLLAVVARWHAEVSAVYAVNGVAPGPMLALMLEEFGAVLAQAKGEVP
jgi:hypothetical protein